MHTCTHCAFACNSRTRTTLQCLSSVGGKNKTNKQQKQALQSQTYNLIALGGGQTDLINRLEEIWLPPMCVSTRPLIKSLRVDSNIIIPLYCSIDPPANYTFLHLYKKNNSMWKNSEIRRLFSYLAKPEQVTFDIPSCFSHKSVQFMWLKQL